eukprot:g3521.t1
MTLGRDERTAELDLQGHFNNIPRSMFTAFRCFSGECFADSGLPIAAVLSTKLGWSFAIFYVLSYMLVHTVSSMTETKGSLGGHWEFKKL